LLTAFVVPDSLYESSIKIRIEFSGALADEPKILPVKRKNFEIGVEAAFL
jgi:hypothetical protein